MKKFFQRCRRMLPILLIGVSFGMATGITTGCAPGIYYDYQGNGHHKRPPKPPKKKKEKKPKPKKGHNGHQENRPHRYSFKPPQICRPVEA